MKQYRIVTEDQVNVWGELLFSAGDIVEVRFNLSAETLFVQRAGEAYAPLRAVNVAYLRDLTAEEVAAYDDNTTK